MAIRRLASRWLNNGKHGLRSRLDHNSRILELATVFIAGVSLCSCDANLFGPESREIAGGYRLKRVGNPNQFALTIPHEDGGLIIDEIGWHQPLIIARAFGSQYWDLIDTAHARHVRVSDMQRKSDPISQFIQIKSVETAWKELDRRKRLW